MKRFVDKFEADQAGAVPQPPAERTHNYNAVAGLVAERVAESTVGSSAERLLPKAKRPAPRVRTARSPPQGGGESVVAQ